MERLEAIVKGRVQGVGFRVFVLLKAKKLGLTGFVKNLHNGGVEVVAHGKREKLLLLSEDLSKCPMLPKVSIVEKKFSGAVEDFSDFLIKH